MPGPLMRILLTSTSLAPIALVYAVLFFFNGNPLRSWSTETTKAIWCFAGFVFLIVVCVLALRFFSSRPKERPLDIVSLKPADAPVVSFVVAYLLPVAFETTLKVNLPVLITVLLTLTILVYTSDSYLVNPLIKLLRYRFYEVTTVDGITCIVVSRTKIRNTEEPLSVRRGADFMYLLVKG